MSVRNGNGRKPRLELTWIGKDEQPRLEPRILLPDHALSYFKGGPESDGIHENLLIQGDNLLALKALEQQYAGKVKCVFIDPPYNTGTAFEQYDDGLEHSLWLSLIRDRIEMLRRLLSDDGSLWITIDDNEAHYLKVACDEVFGRANFVANVVWQKKYARQNDAKWLSISHDHVLVYAKAKEGWRPNALQRNADQLAGYANPDNDPRGPWQSVVYTCAKTRAERPNLYYPIAQPRTGRPILPNESRVWGYDQAKHSEHVREGRLWWGANQEKEKPRLKVFLSEVGTGLVPNTLWLREDAGDNQDAKREAMAFNAINTFTTPKPEKLLSRIIEIATRPGDLVLDSFAGSGTTGAVAHKMRRRWIMVELGDHATTHIVPRLKKVIEGVDPGGVTEAVGWKGGGGFRFSRLAPSLIDEDKFGQKVISHRYNPEMLAEAMCKHMGFTYAPNSDPALFWQQGYATERDFIFTTTQSLTYDSLNALSIEVGADRTLLVCCKAFRARLADFPNLTVKKIPQAVLDNCEWGRDDYSLAIAEPAEDAVDRSDEDPGGEDGGNGSTNDAPLALGKGRREAFDAAPLTEARALPVKRAPLKMDGTTRKPRGAKVIALDALPPTPAEEIAPSVAPRRRSRANGVQETPAKFESAQPSVPSSRTRSSKKNASSVAPIKPARAKKAKKTAKAKKATKKGKGAKGQSPKPKRRKRTVAKATRVPTSGKPKKKHAADVRQGEFW